ncbi:MAG TPA: competence/damage-inducible protein A [Gemmatimonadaceae bacterium]|nr:competence/damage-inducible protein A [Gemmatimonadaceae bacterium]
MWRHRGLDQLGCESLKTHVELVTIGDELLLGFTVDTNGAYLGRRLAAHGISIARRAAVGDAMADIVDAVGQALARTGAVITTGGLGPTSDDLTRDAIAELFGRELRVDDEHLEWMRRRWQARFGRDLPASNVRQAMLPVGATKLDNAHGSAPGILVEDDRGWVVSLPGVPRELRGMADEVLLPLLDQRGFGSREACIVSRTLRTTGIAESLLQDQLAAAVPSVARPGDGTTAPSVAYLPGIEGVDLRLTMRGAGAPAAVDEIARAIRTAIPESIYGEEQTDLAEVLLNACRRRGVKLCVAESCTGGMLGSRITAIPGSSDVFVGGVIAYDNTVKVRHLGVRQADIEAHGAVSEIVVRQMAVGAQGQCGADLALAITGVAGPGGGTPEKPVGLVWICAALGDRVEPRKIHSWGDRNEVRYRAAQAAMDLARRMLA